jgi:hypothetical protein
VADLADAQLRHREQGDPARIWPLSVRFGEEIAQFSFPIDPLTSSDRTVTCSLRSAGDRRASRRDGRQ